MLHFREVDSLDHVQKMTSLQPTILDHVQENDVITAYTIQDHLQEAIVRTNTTRVYINYVVLGTCKQTHQLQQHTATNTTITTTIICIQEM